MLLRLDIFVSCLFGFTCGEGAVDGRGSPFSLSGPLETVAKFPTTSWQMPKACSAPRRGQLLMRALVQLQPGRERAWEVGGWVPGSSSSWFLSGASEPVSAGPRHLGRGDQRPGLALSISPSPQCS